MKMGKKKDEKTWIKGEETQQKATYLKEEIKKSSMHAKDSYDYKKLCVDRRGLLPCKSVSYTHLTLPTNSRV